MIMEVCDGEARGGVRLSEYRGGICWLALWLMSRLIARPIRLWRCVGGVSSTYLFLLRRRLLVPLRRLGVRRRAHGSYTEELARAAGLAAAAGVPEAQRSY